MTNSEPDPAPSTEPAVPTVPDPVTPELATPELATPELETPELETPDYTEGGVPTFDFVRNRIQGRAATAAGRRELDAETPEGRTLAQQEADRDAAARDKLAQIRRSMGG